MTVLKSVRGFGFFLLLLFVCFGVVLFFKFHIVCFLQKN